MTTTFTIGDRVKVFGTPLEPCDKPRDAVYWYTSEGPWKMVVVLVHDEDGWHPEVYGQPFVRLALPAENVSDDMPVWAI